MINKKILSIIIICYNNEKYIKNCLDSVIRKLNNNIEIIIVDDGSTDSSYNIISKCIVNIENIKLISIRNSGISIARNVGLKNAVGKYIMFIDGDDYINIKGIEKIINYIQKNEFDLLLFNTIKYYEKTGKYEIEKYVINDYKNVSISDLIDNKICGRAWRFIYNKKMLDKNKLLFHKSLIYEDEYYIADLIGMDVVLEDGSKFGTLKDVMETGANDVYVVEDAKGEEILLPAIRECILDVDVEKNVMTIHLMKGLI